VSSYVGTFTHRVLYTCECMYVCMYVWMYLCMYVCMRGLLAYRI